jgi:hypothetical protein
MPVGWHGMFDFLLMWLSFKDAPTKAIGFWISVSKLGLCVLPRAGKKAAKHGTLNI